MNRKEYLWETRKKKHKHFIKSFSSVFKIQFQYKNTFQEPCKKERNNHKITGNPSILQTWWICTYWFKIFWIERKNNNYSIYLLSCGCSNWDIYLNHLQTVQIGGDICPKSCYSPSCSALINSFMRYFCQIIILIIDVHVFKAVKV